MNHRRHQTGFTLIELLLYIALVGLLLSAVTGFFVTTIEARAKNQSITEVNEQGHYAMEQLTAAVRNATSITSPAAGTSSAGYTVVVPTASLSPTIASVTSGVLQIKEGAAAAVPLTNSKVQVSSLTVTNRSRSGTTGLLQISFTLSRVNDTGRNEYDYQRTFTTSVGVRP